MTERDVRGASLAGTPQVGMRRKPYFVPIFAFFMGTLTLASIAGRPSFEAYRAVDVLGLIGVGMLFGVGGAKVAALVRGARLP